MILIRLCANDFCRRRDEVRYIGRDSKQTHLYVVECRYCGHIWNSKPELEDDEPLITFRGQRVPKRSAGTAVVIEIAPHGRICVRGRGLAHTPPVPREIAEALWAFVSRLLVKEDGLA